MTAGWHAFNISSDRGSGIGAWNDKEIAAYLATGHASGRGTAAGPMGEAVDQSFSLLAPADIKALGRLSAQRPGGRFLGARNNRPSGSAFAQARR